MLIINRTDDGQLETLSDISAGCWINVIDPPPAEIKRVSEEQSGSAPSGSSWASR